MSNDFLLILAIIVVSWVIFVFNFVLGYYIGRTVESAEQKIEKKKKGRTRKRKKMTYTP